jgi:hypothetical protein
MSEAQLQGLQAMLVLHPNALVFHKIALSMALNQRPQEAQLWLRRMCKVIPLKQCQEAARLWSRQARIHPEIAAVPWPPNMETL